MEVVFPITAVQGDSVCANITILDDDELGCSQEFNVSISNATLNTDITGTPNEAVIRIVDNGIVSGNAIFSLKMFLYNTHFPGHVHGNVNFTSDVILYIHCFQISLYQ